ncbi:GntR family transcriptional regulator [Actinoalloteichus caeruleus]|uniref:GntR family transcriptional regulator n=1 Tax=Actinoalloteichus cyanogriseus TaxID=2893586 RepID=UPI003AAE7718
MNTDPGNSTTAGHVPVHHRIADALRAQIRSGDLAEGDQLPTIRELHQQWGCAPLTARNAVDVLKAEGLVTGGRGRPPKVRVKPERQSISTGMAAEQKRLVLAPASERRQRGAIEMVAGIPIDDIVSTHRYDMVEATEELAREFDISVGTVLQRRNYEMHTHEGRRVAFSTSYIPAYIVEKNPDLLDEKNEPWPGGHQHQLYTAGVEIGTMKRTVIAIEPTTRDRQDWQIDQGTPMLKIRSKSIDIDGRVVELSDAVYPADRTEVVIVEDLPRWPDGYPRFSKQAGS